MLPPHGITKLRNYEKIGNKLRILILVKQNLGISVFRIPMIYKKCHSSRVTSSFALIRID